MRLSEPRVPLTSDADWDDDARPLMNGLQRNGGRVLNIFRTMANHPKLMKRWTVFANHVLFGSTLPARERELIILRTGYLCASGYEWAQHASIGRAAGLTDAEITAIADRGSHDWSPADVALLDATDQLVADKFVTDETWAALSATWDRKQLMDIVFAVGQYTLVSMALNSFGVQIEDDTERFPASLFEDGRFPA